MYCVQDVFNCDPFKRTHTNGLSRMVLTSSAVSRLKECGGRLPVESLGFGGT